jgi:hypothetical protein
VEVTERHKHKNTIRFLIQKKTTKQLEGKSERKRKKQTVDTATAVDARIGSTIVDVGFANSSGKASTADATPGIDAINTSTTIFAATIEGAFVDVFLTKSPIVSADTSTIECAHRRA